MSAHRIDATGSGSSPFPTPAASCYGTNQSPSPGASVRESLDAGMATRGAASNPETRRANGRTVNLGDAVAYWPTPTAGDASSSGNRTGNPDSKAHAGLSLTDATVRTWNTPRSRDWKGGGKDCLDADVAEKTPGSLNPDWVEALMGWPIGWSGPPLEESGRAEEINTTGSLLAFFPEEPEPTSEGSASARSATGKSRPASSPRGASSPAEPWRAEP
jgi:hypothetical protein